MPVTNPIVRRSVQLNCRPGRTKQSFKKEADINNILKNWIKTGQAPTMREGEGVYGDFTNATDYQTAVNQVKEAERQFSELPAEIRDRFKNSPVELVRFLENEANLDEAMSLGLIPEPELAPESTEAAPARSVPSASTEGEETPPA